MWQRLLLEIIITLCLLFSMDQQPWPISKEQAETPLTKQYKIVLTLSSTSRPKHNGWNLDLDLAGFYLVLGLDLDLDKHDMASGFVCDVLVQYVLKNKDVKLT